MLAALHDGGQDPLHEAVRNIDVPLSETPREYLLPEVFPAPVTGCVLGPYRHGGFSVLIVSQCKETDEDAFLLGGNRVSRVDPFPTWTPLESTGSDTR